MKSLSGVVGIDEVGRGAWAGPLVVGAVQLSSAVPNLRDSKLIHRKNRAVVSQAIHYSGAKVGLGWVGAQEVDDLGLTKATTLAINRALKEFIDYDEIIIDGSFNYLPENDQARCVVNADETIAAVSAASIVAKVARDEYMIKLAQEYHGYGFENNVGYGTKQHSLAIEKLGLCPEHRLSYKPLQKVLTQ